MIGFAQLLGYIQAKPCARVTGGEKGFEYLFRHFGCNTGTVVYYINDWMIEFLNDATDDLDLWIILGAMFSGIITEIGEDLS